MSGRPDAAPVIDLHCDSILSHLAGERDLTARSGQGQLDLPRMREGGLDAEVFAVFVDPAQHPPGVRAPFARKALAELERLCAATPGLTRALGPAELEDACAAGALAAIPGVEGGHALDGDSGRLEEFHALGARVLTLTWNNSNELGRSCVEPDGTGLTTLGREAVRRLNRLGLILDLSHAAPETFYDALELSIAPVICSHSGARALCDHPRNLDDEQLRMLGRQGGLVGVVFLPWFLAPGGNRVTVENVLDHIEHITAVAGPAAVGLGSDFDGFNDPPPAGLEDVTKLPALAEGMARRGFPEPDIRGILGGNFLRAWRAVVSAARQTGQ